MNSKLDRLTGKVRLLAERLTPFMLTDSYPLPMIPQSKLDTLISRGLWHEIFQSRITAGQPLPISNRPSCGHQRRIWRRDAPSEGPSNFFYRLFHW
jgi:hypothetical protein